MVLLGKVSFVLPALSLMLLAAFARFRGADPDLFARVAAGRLFVEHGQVPRVDPFAYTKTKTLWIDHEWLSGLIFYHFSQAGGDWLLFASKLAVCILTIFILLKAHLASRRTRKIFFPVLLLTIYPSFYVWGSTIRSQVFTYLCLALLLLALAEYDNSRNTNWLMVQPVTFLFWANAHGGVVAGLGLFALYLIGRRITAGGSWLPEVIFLACVAVTLVNPYPGFSYWQYLWSAISMARPDIGEWRADKVAGLCALVLHFLLVMFLYGWWRVGRSRRIDDLLLMLASAFFAYRHQRLHAIFLFVAAVRGAPYIENAWETIRRWASGYYQRFARVSAASMLVLLIWSAVNLVREVHAHRVPIVYDSYPLRATDWLIQQAASANTAPRKTPYKLLVSLEQGSFALWRLYPDYQVSMDGRYEEVYPDSIYQEVRCALEPQRPCHKSSFEAVYPDYILVGVNSSAYRSRDLFGESWKVVYEDNQYALLAQTNFSGNAGVLRGSVSHRIWSPRF